MKHGVKQDLFFLLQYPVIMILWYWLFRDDPVARFAGGTVVAVYSLLILVRPRWFPNRPGVFGRHFPGGGTRGIQDDDIVHGYPVGGFHAGRLPDNDCQDLGNHNADPGGGQFVDLSALD